MLKGFWTLELKSITVLGETYFFVYFNRYISRNRSVECYSICFWKFAKVLRMKAFWSLSIAPLCCYSLLASLALKGFSVLQHNTCVFCCLLNLYCSMLQNVDGIECVLVSYYYPSCIESGVTIDDNQ